ncbi:putative disease resistance protein rga3 [Phtheirospermum japonicum]|uniref:Putative disease resistance protein rga3 n=1 Tax=Phtheirospermum japonicum TaxID=374723 RepID=A0A830BEC1_9LAMI|nr:putative disease resistance protein rga3 [Phtheirospermum japonicum]
MEAVVVGAVVGASIQVLVQNLLTMSQEQIGRDLKKDFEKLKKSFLMVCDFLYDAEMRQVNDRAVKRWLRDLEALAFDADNVIDEINYQLLSKKVQTPGNKMTKKVQSFFSHSKNPIANHLRLGRKIRDINRKLEQSNQEAIGFGLHMRLAGAPAPVSVSGSDASASMDTDSFTVDPIVLGRENDVSRIVEMLITTSPAEQTLLSVLPIVGMGGLGKTTLARLVFGHAKVKSHFETCVWVHVPRKFDVVVLLKNILTSLTAENVEHGNREALLKKLQNNLGAKRYMLVLDDVWNEEREKWDSFANSLLGISYATGNCMIVTTRSQEVASIVTTLPIHELKSLSEDDCWSIIKARALRAGDNPLEFETIGTNIAKRCKGLPLAAKVVGGLLSGKSKDEWLSIGKNWVSNFGDGDPILKILKLSFDNLPQPSLKKCFAYCSIFPKGFEIEKEQLIELWVAEGFLQTDQRSNTVENTGSRIFNLLLQNSLLQVADRDYYGNVTHCNMHDLLHDLACSILGENDSDVKEDSCCQNRYMGYKSNGDESLSIRKEQTKCLRTLILNGRVSDIMFSDFKSLHTLTLVGEDIFELPTSVGELIHLRYLDTSGTRIRDLPDSIGELYHLQTLRAKKERKWEMSYLEHLPNSLKYSISLRHLHIPYHTTLPPEIGRLTSLQTLSHFCVGHNKGCGISELGSLKDLKGKLEIRNLENVRDKKEAMSADLSRKHSIYKLKLKWDPFRECEANDKTVLEGLEPHPNLKSLEICGYKGKSLPLCTSNMENACGEGLHNLIKIKLENCSECEQLPMLGHLPHLKSLHVSNLRNVRSIKSSFYGNISSSGVCERDAFHALERLELLDMPNLTEWEEVDLSPPCGGDQIQIREVVVFPCLKYLKVKRCAQLIRAPSHFPCLDRLEISNMKSSLPLENICGMKLTSLKDVSISQIEELECLPDGLFSNNHNLSSLRIYDCPKMTSLVRCLLGGAPSLKLLWISSCLSLRELADDLHSLSSLEELHIHKCPDLASIPYPSSGGGGGGHEYSQQGFTSLRRLEIKSCHGLFDLPIQMVESRAPSLETLSLIGLNSLLFFPRVIGCLNRMPRLTSLGIHQVPRFSINSALSSKLYYLRMGPFSDSMDYVSFEETFHAILKPSHFSLRNLELYGMEQWVRLPDQLQHLTSLSELSLHDFGIAALPEWFGNLSSLCILGLSKCKRLRRLPSKDAMQRLTKLTHLHISDCPMLITEASWISHINVTVDGIPTSSTPHGY